MNMEMAKETRRAGGAAGLGKTSSLGNRDMAQNHPAPQAENPRAVREAKLELLREAIHEACGFIRLHAEVCQTLAEAGDDAGLIHSLSRLILYAKEAARSGNDLRAVRSVPE
jgi:hypothetical protein